MRKVKSSKVYDFIFVGYPDVVTVADACLMLGVCRKTVYCLIRIGKLPVVLGMKHYRIAKFHIIDYILNESKAL